MMVMPPITVTAPAAATLGSADTATEGDVSQAQIEQQPRYRVGEILESMPGLIITQHSGEGKANQYFLRGFDLDHGTDIAISLDDMPVN
ncbi:MAG: TonB-dependent receptor plug domain-containing protein, partial [Alphaproteobacteria bacterium]|nr:TonB-dependent receptor plug domain-containing protein [Alphaproteobacteria bacterium]